jgi:hypothetical protein
MNANDLTLGQDTNINEPTRTATPVNPALDPLDVLIRDYTMGQPTASQQTENAAAFTPEKQINYSAPGALFDVAGNIAKENQKGAQRKQIAAQEQVQNEKAYKLSQAFTDQTSQVLKDATDGNISYNDAISQLGALQIKAEGAGLKHVSDVIGNVAQKQLLQVAKIHETRYQKMTSEQANSTAVDGAQQKIDTALSAANINKDELSKLGIDIKSSAYYYDKDMSRQPYTGKQDDGKQLFVDNKTIDNAINAAKAAKITQRNPVLGKKLEEGRKAVNMIESEFSKAELNKQYVNMDDQGKKNFAANYIQRLVSNGKSPEDAYSFVVRVVNPTFWQNVGSVIGLGKVDPHMAWSLEDIMGVKIDSLNTAAAEWGKLREEEDKELGIGSKPAPAKAVSSQPATPAPTKSKFVTGKKYKNAAGEERTWDGTKFVK